MLWATEVCTGSVQMVFHWSGHTWTARCGPAQLYFRTMSPLPEPPKYRIISISNGVVVLWGEVSAGVAGVAAAVAWRGAGNGAGCA